MMIFLSLNGNVIRTRAEDPIVWSGGSAAEQVTHDSDDDEDDNDEEDDDEDSLQF